MPSYPPLSPGTGLFSTVGFWSPLQTKRLPNGEPDLSMDFDSPAEQHRRRLSELWNIPETEILLNISVATANDTLAAADAPALGAFANYVNASVVSISNLYQSFCVEPMPSPPPNPPGAGLPSPPFPPAIPPPSPPMPPLAPGSTIAPIVTAFLQIVVPDPLSAAEQTEIRTNISAAIGSLLSDVPPAMVSCDAMAVTNPGTFAGTLSVIAPSDLIANVLVTILSMDHADALTDILGYNVTTITLTTQTKGEHKAPPPPPVDPSPPPPLPPAPTGGYSPPPLPCDNVPQSCQVCEAYAYCATSPDANCNNAPVHCMNTCSGWAHCTNVSYVYACPSCSATEYPINATHCETCPAGHYCPAMTSVPVPCGNGTYNSFTGAGMITSCVTCPPGYNCPVATAFPISCHPGSFSGGGAATCTLCPQGTYQTLGGQSDCTNCTTGSWSCPEGAISPMWSAIPTPSPPPIPPGAAQVSGQITLAGDLASFDEASFKSNLATQLSTDCSCTINVADIVVATSAGSVVVEYTITAPDATAAAATQSTLTTPATLSTVLQVTVEGAGAFPSPPTMPPPPPPLPPPPPPSAFAERKMLPHRLAGISRASVA